MGSDGAAGGPPGARRVPTGPRRARGDAVACPGGWNTKKPARGYCRNQKKSTNRSRIRKECNTQTEVRGLVRTSIVHQYGTVERPVG